MVFALFARCTFYLKEKAQYTSYKNGGSTFPGRPEYSVMMFLCSQGFWSERSKSLFYPAVNLPEAEQDQKLKGKEWLNFGGALRLLSISNAN